MRLTGRQQHHLTALQAMRLAGDQDFGLTFQHLHQRIERRDVFTQPLALVKGKKGHIAGGPLDNLPADDRPFLILDEISGPGDLRAG